MKRSEDELSDSLYIKVSITGQHDHTSQTLTSQYTVIYDLFLNETNQRNA